MKINKSNLSIVKMHSPMGRIIACATYLANKEAKGLKIGNSIHEQVAGLTCKGLTTLAIAKKTGFCETTVRDAIRDIQNMMGVTE